jgi:hypothetical protein
LHEFGFRPDLTRRSSHARISRDGRKILRAPAESVAVDACEMLYVNDVPPSLGFIADAAMQTYRLHEVAFHIHEPTFQYLVAASNVGRKSDELIGEVLMSLNRTSIYQNNDPPPAIIETLRVLASIPDAFQQHRISYIFLCDQHLREDDTPLGLCVAARHIFHAGRRNIYHHHNDMQHFYERYVAAVKELIGIIAVLRWLNDNRTCWSFMEREIMTPNRQHRYHPHQGIVQSRGDYSVRRDADVNNIDMPMDHHQHSDSDNVGVGESEEDDDSALNDTRYDDDEDMNYANDGPRSCIVSGAGNSAVNGEYFKDGVFENALKFTKEGKHNGTSASFSIFKCNVSNNTQHWYISVVPSQGSPGTSADIDFYSAPAGHNDSELPPRVGWTKSNEGIDPSPSIEFPPDGDTNGGMEPNPVTYDQDEA